MLFIGEQKIYNLNSDPTEVNTLMNNQIMASCINDVLCHSSRHKQQQVHTPPFGIDQISLPQNLGDVRLKSRFFSNIIYWNERLCAFLLCCAVQILAKRTAEFAQNVRFFFVFRSLTTKFTRCRFRMLSYRE